MQNAASTDPRNTRPSDHHDLWDHLLRPSSPATWSELGSESLTGRRILITGAGGSIGSALAHAAAASMPASLVLLDNSENALYQVDHSLRQVGSREHTSLLGSVCSRHTLDHVFKQHAPDIIFHVAALKHVPLMEQNPFATIENNALGTHTLAEAAVAHEVEQLMLVSTDKAVEPSSIMGASKRIAELLLLSGKTSTRMTVVRLCNVIGSQGSVLPLFLEQLARGGPLTVTDPEVQRYFLTMDQTVAALFDALAVRTSPILLLPEVGPAVRIVDLARHLLEIHQAAASIEHTGLRPGDKLSEQLVSRREYLSQEAMPGPSGLRAIETPSCGGLKLAAALETLREAIHGHDLQQLLQGVWALVPEYQPSSLITAAINVRPATEFVAGTPA